MRAESIRAKFTLCALYGAPHNGMQLSSCSTREVKTFLKEEKFYIYKNTWMKFLKLKSSRANCSFVKTFYSDGNFLNCLLHTG